MSQPQRRNRIQRVAEAKRSPPMRYWMSRDSVNGVLSDRVAVWLVRPERRAIGRAVSWTCDDIKLPSVDGLVSARRGTWSLAEALKHARTYPDDDQMLIVVGNPITA